MTSRIAQLLRTNIALALLCVIAIGVLIILFRQPERSGEAPVPKAQTVPSVVQTGTPGVAESQSVGGPVEQASFENMPSPKTFRPFTYSGQDLLNATGTCADAYEVLMIFPDDTDYRTNPGSAKYNTAEACAKGASFSKDVALKPLNLIASSSYYLIRASEGTSGTWYNPY